MQLLKPLLPVFALLLLFQYGCEKDTLELQMENCNCDLAPDPGTCKASIPRYYYDDVEEKCKQFIWGGCFGTVPFETLEECEACQCHN